MQQIKFKNLRDLDPESFFELPGYARAFLKFVEEISISFLDDDWESMDEDDIVFTACKILDEIKVSSASSSFLKDRDRLN